MEGIGKTAGEENAEVLKKVRNLKGLGGHLISEDKKDTKEIEHVKEMNGMKAKED